MKQSWFKMDSSTSSNLEVCCTLTESGVNEIGPENGTSLQGFGKERNEMEWLGNIFPLVKQRK